MKSSILFVIMKKYLLVCMTVVIAWLAACQPQGQPETGQKPYVVVLSLDGFRWDYAQRTATPNLDYLAENGVKAEGLIASFPTKTFPNHYTLATGLYPGHHGLVQNNFYAPNLDRTYSIGDRSAVEDGVFYGGEPIWVTAEKQDVRSASYFWVGSEAPVQGIQPTYWKSYEHGFPFEQRIDSVIHWLRLPDEKRPQLIMWYMHEPDAIGHRYGPDSEYTLRKVHYLDSLVGVFLNKLQGVGVAEQVNVVVLSDHGMGAIANERMVTLTDYISPDWLTRYHGGNPVYLLQAKPGKHDSIYQALRQVPHLTIWPSDSVPERLHYSNHPRLLDFVVVADSAYSISMDGGNHYTGGAHGYDNRNKDMNAIFYAMGPAFKKGYNQPAFANVHVYALVAHLLDLTPAETDGDLTAVEGMLVE